MVNSILTLDTAPHRWNTSLEDDTFPSRTLFFKHFGEIPNQISVAEVPWVGLQALTQAHNWQVLQKHTELTPEAGAQLSEVLYAMATEGLWMSIAVHHERETAETQAWVRLLYSASAEAAAQALALELQTLYDSVPKKPQIYLLKKNANGVYQLADVALQPANVLAELQYSPKLAVDLPMLTERLQDPQGKGILILHGQPGTGKTMLIRYLAGAVTSKKFIFITPDLVPDLARPELVTFLLRHPNNILVIEEADLLLRTRGPIPNPAITNILNMTDGLLSDFLRMQIICTLNGDYTTLDKALLRKGRLIGRYAFDKLPVDQVRALTQHLGIALEVSEPLTLADVYHPELPEGLAVARAPIGFGR